MLLAASVRHLTLTFGILALITAQGALAEPRPLLLSLEWSAAAPPAWVHEEIRGAARDPHRFFSLGESHLYERLNRSYFLRLAEAYYSEATLPRACVEEGLLGKDDLDGYLRSHSSEFWISTGNSPRFTRFQQCAAAGRKLFAYSGFFHQFPLPKVFPEDFMATPVATEPGNTISTQIFQAEGLYVSAIDLVFVENQSTIRMLQGAPRSREEFRESLQELRGGLRSLKLRMTELAPESPTNPAFFGAYYPRSAILGTSDVASMPEDAYLLFTNPGFRMGWDGFSLLSALGTLPEERLLRLYSRLKANPRGWVYTQLFDFVDSKTGREVPFRFGPVLEHFPAGTEFLMLFMPRSETDPLHSFVIAASPGESALRCYVAKEQDAAVPLDCSEIF